GGAVTDLLNGANPGPIQLLTADGTNLQGLAGGAPPLVTITSVFASITSDPNTLQVGFNAAVRVIVEGNNPTAPNFPGLTIASDHNRIRGLAIDGFSTGISIQGPNAIGNLIQGNYLGEYLAFPNTTFVTAPSV